ncbi:hypothetical protein BX666DRAFT_1905609 [Dichotomocladium elegans]|nr:hypothetical protein BX666DRAFT_1905609 [Dichotomocladium elegans]
MASIYFDDYAFPNELYQKDTMDFAIPIRTLLNFTPHILKELPKDPKEQKPLQMPEQQQPRKENGVYAFVKRNNHHIGSFLKYLSEQCIEYMASSVHEQTRQKEQPEREQARRAFCQTAPAASCSKERTTEELQKDEEAKKKKKQQQKIITQSAVAVGAFSFSAYSTYQASVAWGDVTFQNQLELLLDHVEEILRSTTVWIEEHDKLGDPIPDLVRQDVIRLKRLVDHLIRLDSRSKRRQETAGWGLSALGGLSVLSGVALGSAAVLTGGAAVAIGGVLVMVAAKGSSRAAANVRGLVEAEAVRVLRDIEKEAENRQTMLVSEFESSLLDQAPPPRSNVILTPPSPSKRQSSPPKSKIKCEAL